MEAVIITLGAEGMILVAKDEARIFPLVQEKFMMFREREIRW